MEDEFYGDNSQKSSQGSKIAGDDLTFSKVAIMTETAGGKKEKVVQDVREKLSQSNLSRKYEKARFSFKPMTI